SVCQRVLGDWHAAQDALQATFLVLARKAGMLDRQVPLTNWLYTVAYHAALRLRAVTARNRLTEAAAVEDWPARRDGEVGTEMERLEIQQAVREELQNLPAEYREPLALCYVDGLTHSDAAREIGIPRGSMAKRLGEGLERLKERLVVRGVST
ncbi:MAG TPA: RNA polymerase sigma factor, partial [Gemmataceae bacterium]|nr:RNA polymerase sigma factor [Gemmataceae bacterium]